MIKLVVGYTISYALYLLVAVMGWFSVTRPKLALGTIFYAFANMLLKIILIIVLTTYGWKHVGGCFISTAVKTSVICCSAVEFIILGVYIAIMTRSRQINNLVLALKHNANSGQNYVDSARGPVLTVSPANNYRQI